MKATKPRKKKYTQSHKDGTLWAKGFLLNGKMEGHFVWFRKDGTKMREGYFKNEKQVGKWTTFDKAGRMVKVTDFDK